MRIGALMMQQALSKYKSFRATSPNKFDSLLPLVIGGRKVVEQQLEELSDCLMSKS
jgi:hypothetical protein